MISMQSFANGNEDQDLQNRHLTGFRGEPITFDRNKNGEPPCMTNSVKERMHIQIIAFVNSHFILSTLL